MRQARQALQPISDTPDSQRGRALLALREKVLRGELSPGKELNGLALGRMLGLPRTQIRAALERLIQEGLLELIDGGFHVREFSLRDIGDAIEARGVLEGAAARLAAERLTGDWELDPARQINDELATLLSSSLAEALPPDSDEMLRYAELNKAFHAAIVNLAKSPMLGWSLERIQMCPFASPSAVVQPRSSYRSQTALAQHQAILDAIAAQDGTAAETASIAHARFARKSLESVLQSAPAPIGTPITNRAAMASHGAWKNAPELAPNPDTPATSNQDQPILDRLLDTAAALFHEKSYGGTTTREIAARAGIQQASLYHHMANKEDLLYQICLAAMREFHSDVTEALVGVEDPQQRIHTLVRAHLAALLKHPQRNLTMLTELRALSRGHRAEIVALRGTYATLVRGILEAGQRANVLRSDIPAKYLTLALLNMLNWTALWHRTPPQEHLLDLLIKVFFEGTCQPSSTAPTILPDFTGASTTDARRGPRPRRRAKSDNPTLERLVSAAAELFSKNGYTATSTREVATLLGLEKTSLYYHIESKEDLLFTICQSSVQNLQMDVEEAIAEVHDPRERIRTLIGSHVASMLRDTAEHATTLAEMRSLSPVRFAEIATLQEAYEAVVRTTLRDAQEAGIIRPDIDAQHLAFILQGLLSRILVWYRRGGPLTPDQLGQVVSEIFLTGAVARS